MSVPGAFKVVTLDTPLDLTAQHLNPVASTPRIFFFSKKNNRIQGLCSALRGPLEDARLKSGKPGVPERRELAPFRGQRSDVAGHGQGIQPRC